MVEALRIEDLSVEFRSPAGTVRALNGVSLAQNEGETYCLVGESGAGKSTLALAVMGLLPQNSSILGGRIYFQGVDLMRAGQEYIRSLRGHEVSMVFQDAQAALNPVEQVGSQLEEVITQHSNVSLRNANRMAQDMLHEMGLPDPKRVMGQYPFALSGGMCQRVMMAIALVLRPKLIIADEPTSGLDVTLQAEILERLRRLVREQGSSILLITHDMGVVASMANKVGVIYGGYMVEYADVIPLFRRALHPYTWSLLQSLPRLDDADRMIHPVPGNPPDLVNMGEQCPFLPRCFKATNQCRHLPHPPLTETEPGHYVACYNPVVPQEAELSA
jgi:oligopeptide/dipeptide ABC transporter ATP-binding protein